MNSVSLGSLLAKLIPETQSQPSGAVATEKVLSSLTSITDGQDVLRWLQAFLICDESESESGSALYDRMRGSSRHMSGLFFYYFIEAYVSNAEVFAQLYGRREPLAFGKRVILNQMPESLVKNE